MSTSKMKGFYLWFKNKALINELTNEQAGILLKNIFLLAESKELIEMDTITRVVFAQLKNDFDECTEKYNNICEKRKNAGKYGAQKRWQMLPNDSKCYQMIASVANTNTNTNTNTNNNTNTNTNNNNNNNNNNNTNNNTNTNNIGGKSKKIFQKPTLEEIAEEIKEKNYSLNAEHFFNYYEANGWNVGKNKMKNWKAALAMWNSKENKDKKTLIKNTEYGTNETFFE